MENQTATPLIRFPEFIDHWHNTKLSELLKEAKKRNGDLKYTKDEVLSVSGEMGIVNQIEHLGRSYAGVSVHQYHIVEVGDVVYTKSPLKANPYGIIKQNKKKAGIVSTLYAVYNVIEENALGEFIEHYFSLVANTNRYLRPLVKKGAKNDMKISNTYVLHDKIFIPTVTEQKKITSFLNALDKKIDQLKQKKILLEEYKKGIMQKIFSQELRFKDFNKNEFPDWELKKLGEISKRKTNKNKEGITNVLTISAQLGLISQLEFFNKSVSAKDVSGYYLLEKGDFAYNRSYSKGYPTGAIKCLNRYDKGVVSTLYICFFFFENINNSFMEQYFESGLQNKEIEMVAQEGARNHGLLNIGLNDFFGIQLYIPCLEEQTKIANFLSAIDEKINQCQAQIVNTEVWKKGVLQQMFC
jgi:type I restriction enzyme S subunit